MPSFVRGIFSGAIHDALLFPYPDSLDRSNPAEAKTVRRFIDALHQMQADGLIDSASFDEEETIPEPTIAALAEHGLLGLTIPTEYGGAGLSPAGYARVFGAVSKLDASLAVLIGVQQPSCSGAVTLIAGRRYVTSARHCLEDVLAPGVVSPEAGAAQEVTGRLSGTVRVFDPEGHRVIASLDRIAVGTGEADLLVATTRDATEGFRSKPARTVDRGPAVGDEVATWAASGANGFVPHRLVGIYLGTRSLQQDDGQALTVDLVGYRQTAAMAAIGPGHSGHSPTGAGGTAFGPLLFSLNRDVRGDERTAELAAMADATGIDLQWEIKRIGKP